jgi:hypothetical protein
MTAFLDSAARLDDVHVGLALLGALVLAWVAMGTDARARAIASLARSLGPPRE